MLAKHALYQLSYGPNRLRPARRAVVRSAAPVKIGAEPRRRTAQRLVGPGRLELPTSRLSGVRTNQLSYGPRGDRLTAAGSGARWARDRARTPEAAMGEEERETETATFRTWLVSLNEPIGREGPGGSSLERR